MNDSFSERNGDPNGPDTGSNDEFPSGLCLDVRELDDLVDDRMVSLLDAEGRVATWNDEAKRLTGYAANEIVDAHYRVFFPEETREARRPERLLERARAEGKATDEGWRLRSDGSRLWVREVIAPIRTDGGDDPSDADGSDDGDGTGESAVEIGIGGPAGSDSSTQNGDGNGDLVGYARLVHDRTEEYERERELREEKALTESIFEAQPDIVYAFDTEGNYLKWNDRVREVTGYTDAELAEMGPLEFVAPEHRDRIAEKITRILEEDEYVTAEADLVTKDGTRIPYEFNSARITDTDGSVLGFTGVGRDISDRKARERELREEKALTESIFEAQPDLLYAYDTAGNLIHWNDRMEQVAEAGPDELTEMRPLDFIAPPDREHIGEAIERILESGERVTAEGRIVTPDGKYVPYEFNSAPITDEDGTILGFTGIGRDISERKTRERELERLERLNATIRRVDETMVAAETRDEIETAVVEAFADADAYQFAAIGRVETATDEGKPWDPRTWAGIDAAEIDALTSFVDPPPDAPGDSTLETGTVQCFRRLRDSPVAERRTHAREHDYGSIAVVPITAGDRTFGLLVVAATADAAFADREREVLTEFGGTIGHALNAMAVRRLLYQDTAVELEFESTDRQDVCLDLSAHLRCRLHLDHVLPLTDERYVYYVTVAGVDPERVRSFVADHGGIDEFRRIDAEPDESHWEIVVRGPTITGLLAEYGARIRSKVVDDGVAELVIEVSPDVDVRDLVEAVTTAYPETDLTSKRTVERSVETSGEFRRRVRDALTEKQHTALEAAYYGGYFEWPTRHSDASEIADRLGIARQTFHQHLRVAQEKLLAAYFEAGAIE